MGVLSLSDVGPEGLRVIALRLMHQWALVGHCIREELVSGKQYLLEVSFTLLRLLQLLHENLILFLDQHILLVQSLNHVLDILQPLI